MYVTSLKLCQKLSTPLLLAGLAVAMEYDSEMEHTSGYKVLPPDVATEAAAPTSCDPSQRRHNESEFENGDSLLVAPPISRSPEPDSGSESKTCACVNVTAPPTTISGAAAVCSTISPNYCPVDFPNNGFSDKLQGPSIEDATEAEGSVEACKAAEDLYRSSSSRDQENGHDNGLLELGGRGVASSRKRHISHHQDIILEGEEGELVTTEKRRYIRLSAGDVLRIGKRDQHRTAGTSTHEQQRVAESVAHLPYGSLRVTHEQQGLEARNDVTDAAALYGREGGRDRYRLEQLTAGHHSNNDMPYSSTSLPPSSLEDVRMRHQQNLVQSRAGEHVNTDGILLATQSPHSYQIHGQGMRIRSDAFPFGLSFPHLNTIKTIPEPHFSTSTQGLSFGIQENHQSRENQDTIDKARSHNNRVNGIDDVIHATLKPEDEVNSSDETGSERNHHQPHHQYLLSRADTSPDQDNDEYLQRHQETSSPGIRRNRRSASPSDHHLQHHRDVILSGRTHIHNSAGGGGGGERTPLLSNSNLSSGTASAGNNSSNTTSFTHLTTLQPSSTSTPSPLALGGNTTAEDGGGGSGSVLQQLSPAGADETDGHRGMYATTPTSTLEHHHHLPGLHHSAGFHHHDTAAVSSASALMHSPAASLSR